MQVSNSSFARPWKLEQNTSRQASRFFSLPSPLGFRQVDPHHWNSSILVRRWDTRGRAERGPVHSPERPSRCQNVISGLLARGSPGFRTVLCCFFFSHLLYGDFICGAPLLFVICFLAIPILFVMQSHYP